MLFAETKNFQSRLEFNFLLDWLSESGPTFLTRYFLFQYSHVPSHSPHPPCYSQHVQLPLPTLPPPKPPHRIFGMRGSDIDKYSRVIFPIMFFCFHMIYWTIYLSISGEIPEDLVYLE